MNDRITQAVIRAIVVAIAAAATAVGADAANIIAIGTDDPILSSMILSVLLGIVQFVLKYIGGATIQVDPEKLGAGPPAGKSPNILAT